MAVNSNMQIDTKYCHYILLVDKCQYIFFISLIPYRSLNSSNSRLFRINICSLKTPVWIFSNPATCYPLQMLHFNTGRQFSLSYSSILFFFFPNPNILFSHQIYLYFLINNPIYIPYIQISLNHQTLLSMNFTQMKT